MADINPTTRLRNSVFHDGLDAEVPAGRRIKPQRLRHDVYFAPNISNGNDFSAPRGVIACAWQANGLADIVSACVQTSSQLTSIRLFTAATTPDGWIHVLSGGTQDFSEPNDVAVVGRGTAGYVASGRVFVNHKSATPNTLTQAKVAYLANLKLQFAPFTLGSTSDRWKAATGTRGTDTLCKGIVAVAWQAAVTGTTTDAVAATLDASGDVVFTSAAGGEDGYLWILRRA
jgi:hypothetical protein